MLKKVLGFYVLVFLFSNALYANLSNDKIKLKQLENLVTAKYNVYMHHLKYGTVEDRNDAFAKFKTTFLEYDALKKKVYEEENKDNIQVTTSTKPAKPKSDQFGIVDCAIALNFRSGPGTSNKVIGTLYSGKNVKILSKQNGWYKVEVDGKIGWASGKYIKLDKTSKEDDVVKVEKEKWAYANVRSGLNFRTGPSLGKTKISTLRPGQKMKVLGKVNDWYKVEVNGKVGYVYARYVAMSGESSSGNSGSAGSDAIVSGGDTVIGNVPIRNQHHDAWYRGVNYGGSWCGPTSVGMVMDYYGINLKQSDLAIKCRYTFKTRSGTPTSGMVSCAKELGFKNSHETWNSSMNLLKSEVENKRPVIVLVDTKWKGHYIVVRGFKNGKVICNDPGSGKIREYSESYFYTMWKSRGKRAVVIKS